MNPLQTSDNPAEHQKALLEIESLRVSAGPVEVLRDVSLQLAKGEMLGLVGESGCGKSVTALSIMNLLPSPPMQITGGQIHFQQKNLASLSEHELQAVRGKDIAMIFQEPMTSLNPVFRIGDQIMEVLFLHESLSRQHARDRAAELLHRVGVASPRKSLDRYPHQLSGGQRQRVMIAMAIACSPALLIADEPTTALDVTIQAQILELLDQLRRETGMAILLITHDLGVIRQYCDRVAVMYCGEIVEQGASEELFLSTRHHYTGALINTIPALNPPGVVLPAVQGQVPSLTDLPAGCAFSPRCPSATERCCAVAPVLTQDSHAVRCWFPLESSASQGRS